MTQDHPDAERLLGPDAIRSFPADVVLFLGIETAGSSVHDLFPRWRAGLGLDDVVLRGVDLPVTAPPEAFRRLVEDMAVNPHVRGAVVTSHKLRLFRACRDLIDRADPEVDLLDEINALGTASGRAGISAHATDVAALETVLCAWVPADPRPGVPVLCLGAGGAATALLLALRAGGTRLGSVTFADVDPAALRALARVTDRLGVGSDLPHLRQVDGPPACRALLEAAPPGTLVVNATGLGKLSPGSPLPDGARWPDGAVAWDMNARGPLTFLEQARIAGVRVVDGTDYFEAGWACALAAITGGAPGDAAVRSGPGSRSPSQTK